MERPEPIDASFIKNLVKSVLGETRQARDWLQGENWNPVEAYRHIERSYQMLNGILIELRDYE